APSAGDDFAQGMRHSWRMPTLGEALFAEEVADVVSAPPSKIRNGKNTDVYRGPIKSFLPAHATDSGFERLVSAMASFGTEALSEVSSAAERDGNDAATLAGAPADSIHMIRDPVMGRPGFSASDRLA